MSSYINHKPQARWADVEVDWYAITWERLASHYGPERADCIVDGRDPATRADIARWDSLGRRDAA